ncbi:MAG: hypothetical protein R3D59_15485 [Paracoccaceae bacterium]
MSSADVEAPEVFQVADSGLWMGSSLGGVWVAHPSVTDPERVIIRNTSNGQFVIGVVYRPERVTPGPKFAVSPDAAAALEMLAGQPAGNSTSPRCGARRRPSRSRRRRPRPSQPAASPPAPST